MFAFAAYLHSGKLTQHNYGKSQFFMGTSAISTGPPDHTMISGGLAGRWWWWGIALGDAAWRSWWGWEPTMDWKWSMNMGWTWDEHMRFRGVESDLNYELVREMWTKGIFHGFYEMALNDIAPNMKLFIWWTIQSFPYLLNMMFGHCFIWTREGIIPPVDGRFPGEDDEKPCVSVGVFSARDS